MKPRIFFRALLGIVAFQSVILSCRPVAAQEASAQITIATNEVWVGERLTVNLELLAPGYFDSAPSFDFPDPPDLLLAPPARHPVVSSREVAGVNYTAQLYELAVFARRPGEQTIPPLTVHFQFKRRPLDKDSVPATVKTEQVKFTSKLPPGAEQLGSVISARALKITETWQPQPGRTNIQAGDAFTRTITFTAPDVPGMLFPPFPAGEVDGLGIYPKPPEIRDHDGRGAMQGERRDTITYVCKQPGRFVIPAVRLTWFDLESQQMRTNDFPAVVLQVQPNPAMASSATTNSIAATTSIPASEKRRAILGFGSGLLLICVVILFWKMRQFWQPWLMVFRPVHLSPLNPPAVSAIQLDRVDSKAHNTKKFGRRD